jgi:hypothetical protein
MKKVVDSDVRGAAAMPQPFSAMEMANLAP